MAISVDERFSDSFAHELVHTETSMQLESDLCSPYSITKFSVNRYTFIYPAPPPRLHYSTFWKSIVRRIYDTRTEATILTARAMSSKLRGTRNQTILCSCSHNSASTQLMQP